MATLETANKSETEVHVGMMPFYAKFRDLAFREMRSVIVPDDRLLPRGQYGFLEFYCTEVGCDCRRVMLHVVRPDTGTKVWASINFGWESVDFYRRWCPGDPEVAAEMAGATLDPFNPQTERSVPLLKLFQEVVVKDGTFIERLGRHYRMFKSAPDVAPAKHAGRGKRQVRRVSRNRRS